MIDEDSVIELEGETIVVINPEWHETVIHIGEAFSGRNGYYANCTVFKVSDGGWGESRITDEFLHENIEDIEYADERYKRFSFMCMFEDDNEDIDLRG